MAKKSTSKPSTPSDTPAPSLAAATTEQPVTLTPRQPVVKVNTANLSELKNAVDDVVREFFSHPSHNFTRSYLHDDVRLVLGWSAVAVAAATGYWGYVTEFHESKAVVGAGVVVYVVLNTLLALYVAFYEKNTIFVGKRRTFASRISTERLTLSSLAASSPKSTTTSSWVPFPISLLAPSAPIPPPSPSSSSSSSSSAPLSPEETYPLYSLHLAYAHSSNANKSLLHARELTRVKGMAGWFDEGGRLARGKVEGWLEEGLREVVGEGGEGKEE
ncbi:hypothetical protein JCM8097_005238 [Rhodosporidiobolus ruineniae]